MGDAVIHDRCCGHGFGECEHFGLADIAVSRDQALGEPGESRGLGVCVDSAPFYPIGVEHSPNPVIEVNALLEFHDDSLGDDGAALADDGLDHPE